MIVVDTNLVAYLLIPGARTGEAEAVRAMDPDWHAPNLLVHEWLNVVTSYVRSGEFDRDQAVRTYKRGLSIVKLDASVPDPIRIINLHKASGCSSYDCEFVELAERSNVKLVTADAGILNAFPGIAQPLHAVA